MSDSSKQTLPHYLPLGIPYVKEVIFLTDPEVDPDAVRSFTLNGTLFEYDPSSTTATVVAERQNNAGVKQAFADAVNAYARYHDTNHTIEEVVCDAYARVVGGRLFLIGRKPGLDFVTDPMVGIQDPMPNSTVGTFGPLGDPCEPALPDSTILSDDPVAALLECHSMIVLLKTIANNTQEIEFTVEAGGVINVLLTEVEARLGDETSARATGPDVASANINALLRGIFQCCVDQNALFAVFGTINDTPETDCNALTATMMEILRGILCALSPTANEVDIFSASTHATVGATFVQFPNIASSSLRFVNRTGVDLEIRRNGGSGITERVNDSESASYPTTGNMSDWEFRRVDLVATSVTVTGAYELD
jgi:hypothetical protein